MTDGHKIATTEDVQKFTDRLRNYSDENIECTPHAFFRLSQKQRELFKCDEIKRYLLEERPILAGIQNNRNFTALL